MTIGKPGYFVATRTVMSLPQTGGRCEDQVISRGAACFGCPNICSASIAPLLERNTKNARAGGTVLTSADMVQE